MRRVFVLSGVLLAVLSTNVNLLLGQSTPAVQTIKGPDERMKVDILVVVAHPDDEGGVTPYLARAIYDEHKRVAVVFATRGGSGGNDYSREHGPALADIREQEARTACAKLGITNVWFLEGKDTASQNVLNSLANWGHGANLEALVRIVRLTRPEVIITWLPGVFIGENHGDHQAAGVLATEAFDLANDPTAFPAQVAGATKRLEVYLENLTPWQPKKLYFFSDAEDQKQFDGTGPAYSIREVSPSQKKPYWRLAIEAATPHLTQFPDVQQFQKMNEEQFNKFFEDPKNMFWPEPMTLIFGKASVAVERNEPVFPQIAAHPKASGESLEAFTKQTPPGAKGLAEDAPDKRAIPRMEFGGPWAYYRSFYFAHRLPKFWINRREIAVKSGTVLSIPFVQMIEEGHGDVNVTVKVPEGWKVLSGEGKLDVSGPEKRLTVEIQTPTLSADELKNSKPQEVVFEIAGDLGRGADQFRLTGRLTVLLRSSALPQN